MELLVEILIKIVSLLLPLILCVAYLTYAERKVIAAMQLRKGPNVVGPFGLLQPIADAIKLMFKEPVVPNGADKILFLLAPIITFALAMVGWAVIPVRENFVIANINVGVLYLLAISSLGVYGIIISGWASNSKYAFLGAIRSSAQIEELETKVGDRVFFRLDSSSLTNEAQATLNKQIAFMNQNSDLHFTLEGHADERGTREYNLGLGERRANAVKQYLVNSGVEAKRLTVVSFGKERPAVTGSNEWAWSQNRRTVTVAQ